MEEVEKTPEEATEPAVFSQNQEAKYGVSTQDECEVKEDATVEVREDVQDTCESQTQDEELIPQVIIKLQRDLTALVTNIETAAGAKELKRRTELEEVHRIRLERLENDAKSSQDKFEKITRGWSTAKEEVIHQELQKALNHQQQLCSAIIEDKKRLINDLQQELKVGDDCYVKDLRKQAEELDLMMERMQEQTKTLEKAYREHLAQMERVYQQEMEDSLNRDKTDWEQHIKKVWDEEMERLMKRNKKVEKYEATIHSLMLKSINQQTMDDIEQDAQIQDLDREHCELNGSFNLLKLEVLKKTTEVEDHNVNLTNMKKKIESLESEIKKKSQQFTMQSQNLSEYCKPIQQYECLQMSKGFFENADAIKYRDMWKMLDAEVKQLVDKALVIDSLICKHLGLSWERPSMAFMDPSPPIKPQNEACRLTHQSASQLFQAAHCSQGSVQTAAESMGMYKEGIMVQSESGAEEEGGELSMEALKDVMELLCDEAGFLMDDKLLKLLDKLEKGEQTVMKMGSVLSSLGIENEDLPKLVQFLLKYKQQQAELDGSSDHTQAVASSSMSSVTSDHIHPNQVLPALKSYLEQLRKSRESSARQQSSISPAEAWDSSESKAYWQSMGSILPNYKVQLWKAAEKMLEQHLLVLNDISELSCETEDLEQQNSELRMLLQQSESAQQRHRDP